MPKSESIKLVSGFLDETNTGEIVARGIIDPKSLHLIGVSDYQREVLPITSQNSLIKAFLAEGRIPDVCLGMRGGGFTEREGSLWLQDPVFVVDGLQRISVALHLMRLGKKTDPRLGAITYFNTTAQSEMELFAILNTKHQRLSPNVLVRNLRESNKAIEMIYDLCLDKSFVLYNRVCWNQRMKRSELLTALILIKVNGQLHSAFGPGVSSTYSEAASGTEKTMKLVTRVGMRENLKTFFEVVDGAWGIRAVAYKESAPYLRSTFLSALAQVFAQHKNFWDGNKRLVISPDIRGKFRMFSVNDPQIRILSSAGGTSRQLLYRLMVDFINSGKSKHRLEPFKIADDHTDIPSGDDDNSDQTTLYGYEPRDRARGGDGKFIDRIPTIKGKEVA